MKFEQSLRFILSLGLLTFSVAAIDYKPYLGHINQKKARLLRSKHLNEEDLIDPKRMRTHNQKNSGGSRTTTQFSETTSGETATNLFTPAQPLAYFKNELDQKLFAWFNNEHVQASETTCGFLYPKLGSSQNEPYPTIKVKFCMRFADIQPASKGNMVVHCGGPGSLSSCGMAFILGTSNNQNYNIITLDQRGMGMSWPSFAHKECTYGVEVDDSGNLVSKGMSSALVDATNVTTMEMYLEQQKKRISTCWACEKCSFHLPATDGSQKTYHFLEHSGTRQVAEDIDLFRQVIGSEKISVYGVSYGTQIMATYATMFPNRVDKFVVDSNCPPQPDLHHYASVIAENNHQRESYIAYTCDIRNTMVPGSCDIDLNRCWQTVFHYYEELFNTIGAAQFERLFKWEFTRGSVLDTFKPICDAAKERNDVKFLDVLVGIEASQFNDPLIEECLPGFYNMSVELLENEGTPDLFNENNSANIGMAAYILTFLVDIPTCERFVESANDTSAQESLVYELWQREYEPMYNTEDERHRQLTEADCTGPTYVHALYPMLVKTCFEGSITTAAVGDSEDDYSIIMGDPSSIPQTLVFAQSLTGSSYDKGHVIQEIQEVYRKYGGEYYGESSALSFTFWYTLGYYWPKAQPIAPAGDIHTTGIVSGQLYDYVTSYKFTQEMKAAFPSTTLITSQWTQHGFSSTKTNIQSGDILNDMGDENVQDSCQPLINRYFELGYVPVVDGYVCESDLPDTFTEF